MFGITYTVLDGKGRSSFVSFNVPNPTAEFEFVNSFAQDFAELLQALMNGAITACNIVYGKALTGMTDPAAAASDIEEGAKFLFTSDEGFKSSVRIPTFIESKMIAGTEDVNTADVDVAAFITAVLDGLDMNPIGLGGEVRPATSHGEDLSGLVYAVDAFIKSRSRSRR